MIRSSISQLSNKVKNKRKNKRKNKWISYVLVEKLQIWTDWVVREAPRPQPNSVFAQFSVVCMFNWMLGQLRRVVGRSYVRGRAPNLNRLSSEGKSIKPHPRPNSVFAQFSVVCMFNWMLGQLRKAVGRSYVRGKAPNLNRLSRARKNIKNLALSPPSR